jgi:polysaccharide export outer membrane protein
MREKQRRPILLVGLVLGLILGCSDEKAKDSQAQLEKEFYQPFMQASAIPSKQVELPDYRLNVEDQLEIIFHVKHLTTEEYRLHTEDILVIKFPYHTDYNQTVTINPDGKIRLLLIGEVLAYDEIRNSKGEIEKRGKTVAQLENEVKKRYHHYFKDADLTVTFKAANIKIEELKRAITTAPRGQSRLMPVKPDGNITLPFVGDVRAYGKTIEELRMDLNDSYEAIGIPELEVTVQILSVAPRKIFVMGEVYRPGILTVGNMITLTQALAMAGGHNTRADVSKVLVVRRKNMPVPEGVIIDVEHMLMGQVDACKCRQTKVDNKSWTKDFWLDDYDVVYVPPCKLTQYNDWVEKVFTKGIYGMMPFSTSVNMGFGYQIRNAPTTVKDGTTPWESVVSSIVNQ